MVQFFFFAGYCWVSYAFNGLVLSYIWKWFVVPIFGLPVLTVPQSVGIIIVTAFLTFHPTPKDFEGDTTLRAFLGALAAQLIYPVIAGVAAWILHGLYF